MSNYALMTKGTLHMKGDTVPVTDSFQKREFVLKVIDNPMYPQLVPFQLVQDKCEKLDNIEVGDEIGVKFNLRGKEWQNQDGDMKYFLNLDAWFVKKLESAPQPVTASASPQQSGEVDDEIDDLPF